VQFPAEFNGMGPIAERMQEQEEFQRDGCMGERSFHEAGQHFGEL
jgi:hypothetical protein